jgi:hypothetical protein
MSYEAQATVAFATRVPTDSREGDQEGRVQCVSQPDRERSH